MKTILRNLNFVQCFNIAPMEKVWFYEKLFFKVVIVMVKNNKIRHKRSVSQNQFHALHEVDKSIATRGFCQWHRHWHQHSNINIAF